MSRSPVLDPSAPIPPYVPGANPYLLRSESSIFGRSVLGLIPPPFDVYLKMGEAGELLTYSPSEVRADIGAGTGSGDALTANPLSQFAATTSAQLRSVISDESGTGALLFANGNIGNAFGSSLTITGRLVAPEVIGPQDVGLTLYGGAGGSPEVPYTSAARIVLGFGENSGITLIPAAGGTVRISNLTSNGFVKTSGGTGLLSVDTASYELALGNPGTNGHILSSTTAGVRSWVAPPTAGSVATDAIWDAKGDLAVATGANAASKLTVGANNTVLIADSAQATGIRWGTPASVRTALGLVIGTNVQAWDADLDTWATKTPYAGTLTITTGKTFNVTNTLTLAGTDSVTLNVGPGGTLNTIAYITPGSGVATVLAANVGSGGSMAVVNGAMGTPSSLTLTNATGLPISTGVSGLGSGAATFLATPTLANLNALVSDADVEPALGNPGTNGYVLSSTTAGVRSWVAQSGGGDALTTNPLSQFAATTSLQIKGVISDETGSGALVFANTPSLISPQISNYVYFTAGNGYTGYTNAVGPYWVDDGLGIQFRFNIQSIGGTKTVTWPNADGIVLLDGNIGSTVQAYDADLTSWAAITRASGFDTFTATPTLANLNALVSDADVEPDLGNPGTNGYVLSSTTGGTRSWVAQSVGNALTSNPLSQFAATTSAQLAGVISDETGSGALVFADSPTFINPTLGEAFATNVTISALGRLFFGVTNNLMGYLSGTGPYWGDATVNKSLTFNVQSLTANRIVTWPNAAGTVMLTSAIGTTVQAYDADLDTWAGITPGTGVATALAVNVGSAGAFVTFNGALGTPSSGTLTNATGLPPAGVTGTAAILGANTFTGAQINSTAGAASSSPLYLTGALVSGGTGTTSFPHIFYQTTGATASTTWSTAGTVYGANLATGATANFIDFKLAGAATSALKVTSGGTGSFGGSLSAVASITCGAGNSFVVSGRSAFGSTADGVWRLSNGAVTGFTGLDFGGSTNSFSRIGFDAVNGFTLKPADGSGTTWNDASTAASGAVANRYLFGIAAPTLSATNTSVTDTVASTVYIGGAPTAGTNTTIGTAYALNVASGNTLLGGTLSVTGASTLAGGATVPDDAYAAGWNGSTNVPTKNAVYDKIESLPVAATGTAIFGDGSDGALTYDGSTTILGMAPASSVYTLTRDIYASSLTVNAGVTIKTANFRIFCNGTLTLVTGSPGGKIENNGNSAAGITGGTAVAVQTTSATLGGVNGRSNNTGNSGNGASPGVGGAGGNGGSATNAGGNGGVVTEPTSPQGGRGIARILPYAITTLIQASSTRFIGGASGGGGASNAVSATGGGSGAGGGVLGIYAKTIVINAGAILSANGGDGADGSGTLLDAGGGGGGGGGVVILVYNSYTNSGTVSANGGTAGAGFNAGNAGVAGSAGVVITLNNNN